MSAKVILIGRVMCDGSGQALDVHLSNEAPEILDYLAISRQLLAIGANDWLFARHDQAAGEGPAVIVMTEMPGISSHVARFARWVRNAGFRVYMPSLFGKDSDVPDAETAAGVLRRACVSAESRALGGGSSSPVSNWLRALVRLAQDESGGPGVGAIGMCFTDNFALNMMPEPMLLAPVVSQPSLPLDNPGGIESSTDELAQVRSRLEREDLTVLAYRFAGDSFCRAERSAAYQAALGGRFIGRFACECRTQAAVLRAVREDALQCRNGSSHR
jgi:dienelactone hydrolase